MCNTEREGDGELAAEADISEVRHFCLYGVNGWKITHETLGLGHGMQTVSVDLSRRP